MDDEQLLTIVAALLFGSDRSAKEYRPQPFKYYVGEAIELLETVRVNRKPKEQWPLPKTRAQVIGTDGDF